MIHELKTWPQYFEAVVEGRKTFELRKNDRNFQIGDFLLLKQYLPKTDKYSGEEVVCKITYMLTGGQFGLEEGHCILGIKLLN